MEARLQQLDGDTVLEVTETVVTKTKYSETELLRQKAYFEEMITKAQAGLDEVNGRLALIANEKSRI